MSGINFKIYQTTNRAPGVFAEVDPSLANTGQVNQRTLLIGQMLPAGTYTAGVPVIATGLGDVKAGCGAGSQLALMYQQYRAGDSFGEVWLLPLADAGSSVAAAETITLTGPATAAATLFLYAGYSPAVPTGRVTCLVNVADAATAIATNLAAAINAVPDLPVTATVAGAVITVTARNKGLAGNGIDLRMNYLGALGGETTPAGVTLTFSNPVANGSLLLGGTTNPTLTTALTNIAGDQTFDFIVCPYTDSASLTAMDLFLNDTVGRWSWVQEIFGGYFTAYRGTLSAQVTFGTSRNGQHGSAFGLFDTPTPDFLCAADYAAQDAVSLRADPALPLQTLALNVAAEPLASRFNISQRNTLLYSGISTHKVSDAGVVSIDRAITLYQVNAAGAPDNSYLDVETMYTLQFVIRDMRIYLQTLFARVKLVADGTRIGAGSNMATSQTVVGAAVARYRLQAKAGLVQNPDIFAQQAIGQNAGNGLVKLLLPYQLANQLRQIAMLVQFTKP